MRSIRAPLWASAWRSVARVDLEGERVLAAAVDDSEHLALAPQAARGARAVGLAGLRRSVLWWLWLPWSACDGSDRGASGPGRPAVAGHMGWTTGGAGPIQALRFKAMSGEAQLMLMIAGMHLLGLVCVAVLIIPALREGPNLPPEPDSGSDDGGGWGPKRRRSRPTQPRGGIPLPDAVQARVRLRDHSRLADHHKRRGAARPASRAGARSARAERARARTRH